MPRRRMLQAFQAARALPDHADEVVLPADVDPQILLSRMREIQPFYLAFEEDTVLALMSGKVTVRLRNSNVNYWNLLPGDHVYVPAGTPHRLEPAEESVAIRFVGNDPAYRAAILTCDECGTERDRVEWQQDLNVASVDIYAAIVEKFEEGDSSAWCAACGKASPRIPVDDLGWRSGVAAF